MPFPALRCMVRERAFHAHCTGCQRPRILGPASQGSSPFGRANERRNGQAGDAHGRAGMREVCYRGGYVLHLRACRETRHRPDEGELMLRRCCVALANSLMRLRGWALHPQPWEKDSPAGFAESLAQRNKKLARNHKTVLAEKPIVPAMPRWCEASFPL